MKSGYYLIFYQSHGLTREDPPKKYDHKSLKLLKREKNFKAIQNHTPYNYRPNLKNEYSIVNRGAHNC